VRASTFTCGAKSIAGYTDGERETSISMHKSDLALQHKKSKPKETHRNVVTSSKIEVWVHFFSHFLLLLRGYEQFC
jgi:hypothetical protein